MKKSKNGYTFVEMIISVFLFGVIAAAVANFSAYYFKNYSFSFEESQSIGIAQVNLTRMIKEIREARNGDDGSWPVVQADDNQFIFFSDVDGDLKPDRVRYFLNGTDLDRGVINPTAVPVTYPLASEKVATVASYLDTSAGPIFTYYDGNWPTDTTNNPIATASRQLNTRFVQVKLRINVTGNFAAQPFDLTSGVTIRSLKSNL